MKKYKTLDTSKYKRFFAFGCSMTQYAWPTWADIIAQEIPESYNYGQSGAGNLFIASQVTEAHMRHNFTKEDLVMIMWSSVAREDRYVNQNWLTPGNIYTQSDYDLRFVRKFADDFGYLLRDINLMTLTKSFLENINIGFYMMHIAPFEVESKNRNERKKLATLYKLYKQTFDSMLPDMLTAGVNGTWPEHPIQCPGGQRSDYHPSPAQHFRYLKNVFPDTRWKRSTVKYVVRHDRIMKSYRHWDQLNWNESPKDRL